MTGERDALLIATGRYASPTLRTLRSPVQDVSGLAAVLGDPAIGGFRVRTVTDAPSYQVTRALEEFFRGRGRDDTLLLHLSCHGIKDDDGRLYFAAEDTDKDLPASTAVSAAFVQAQMERCRARSIVVLLDCCYSGAFLAGAKGDDSVHVREELAGHGRVVLTATSRTEYAWEGDRLESLDPQLSRFTGALVTGLRSGAADLDRDGRITVTELYDYVYEEVRRGGVRQTPRMWADVEYQVVIARVPPRPAPQPPPGPPPEPPPAEPPWPARARRGKDALIRLDLTLREAVLGVDKDVALDTAVPCDPCRRTGRVGDSPETACAECRGAGIVADGGTCGPCDGTGTVFRAPCPVCEGHARVRARRTLTVRIPPGIDNGTRLLLAGEGEVGPGGGPAADLYVEIVELPDPRYTRRGDDLLVVERIPRRVAERGGTVTVETFDGPRNIRITPGHDPARLLRLRGLGARRLWSEERGDLLVRIQPAS